MTYTETHSQHTVSVQEHKHIHTQERAREGGRSGHTQPEMEANKQRIRAQACINRSNAARETGQAALQTALKSSCHHELNQLWWYCFIWPLLLKISISPPKHTDTNPHPPALCLKVTLPVCQSLVMTPVLSVIHHVSCVSARCRTSRAVGGLSDALALYNMQIITCKLPNHVCDDISVSMQMQQAIRCVC